MINSNPELIRRLLTPRLNKYIKMVPTPRQTAFLLSHDLEVLYGGAAGGGKSFGIMAAALQYVDYPQYSALILRRTLKALSLPNALMDLSRQWLVGTDAKWSEQKKRWTFPSGASITFGYLDSERDVEQYQGAKFHLIAPDELTQFTEYQYKYLFSRIRKDTGDPIPLRMRAGSNPGGVGHEWVYNRFMIEGPSKGRIFIPAKLDDNPHIERESYEKSLDQLDAVLKLQLLKGDWHVRPSGNKFKREWFEGKYIDANELPGDLKKVWYWDFAATEAKPGKDPDWTAGALVGFAEGIYYIIEVRRLQGRPKAVEDFITQWSETTGREVPIWIEQEGGSGSIHTIDHYQREVLAGYDVRGNRVSGKGSKEVRANPVSSAADAGNVYLVRGVWNSAFIDEIVAFPLGAHDDQVDALSGAFERLTSRDPNAAVVGHTVKKYRAMMAERMFGEFGRTLKPRNGAAGHEPQCEEAMINQYIVYDKKRGRGVPAPACSCN